MALLKCPECGGDISTDAKTCPHCGKILREEQRGMPPNTTPVRTRIIICNVIWIPLCAFGIAAFPFGYVSAYSMLALFVGLLFYCAKRGEKKHLDNMMMEYKFGK